MSARVTYQMMSMNYERNTLPGEEKDLVLAQTMSNC
jgi:hypothetical protein